MTHPLTIKQHYATLETQNPRERYAYISSSSRRSGNSSQAVIQLSDSLMNVSRLRIISACIDYTYFDVDSDSHIPLVENGGSVTLCNLNPGSYTPSSLSVEIARTLTASSPSSATYTCTYSSSTNQYTISNSTINFGFNWTSDFALYPFNFAYNFCGFNNAVSSSPGPDPNESSTTVMTWTSSGTIVISSKYLFINLRPVPSSTLTVSGTQIAAVALVPVDGNFGDKMFFFDNGMYAQELFFNSPITLREFVLELRFSNSKLVELNGGSLAVCIAYNTVE